VNITQQAVLLPSQLWIGASSVVVGSASGERRLPGDERVRLGDGNSIRVYPCQARLSVSATIKGAISVERLLWFSYSPNCSLVAWPPAKAQRNTRVWFLRQVEGWLRPVYDNAAAYLELSQPLNAEAKGPAELRVAFAYALLSPQNVVATPGNPPWGGLGALYSLAVEVVGEQIAYRMLVDLQRESPPVLRADICRLVADLYNQCSLSGCPSSLNVSGSPPDAVQRQRLRHVGEINSISANAVAEAMESASTSKRDVLHRNLWLLSCNVDTAVRRRAVFLLHRYFQNDPPVTCVPCK
jgi:hypothetical protein